MSPLVLTLSIFGIMLVLMAIRIPIAVSMFAAGALGYVMQTGWSPFANFLNTAAFARFASYDLSVIPLFILMGNFATQGGISKALFDFASGVMVANLDRGGITVCAADGSASNFIPIEGDTHITNICWGSSHMHKAYITQSYAGRLVEVDWPEPGLILNYAL